MLPPQRHFAFLYLLIINRLSLKSGNLIKTLVCSALFFYTSTSAIFAQVQTLHNPNAAVTVTNDQVKASGEASGHHSLHPVVLDFEGLGNLDEILQFYNGGSSKAGFSGMNFGVYFNPGALSIIDMQHGGSGNFTTKSLPNTVMFFLEGPAVTITIPAGFDSEFSFQCTATATGAVSIFDGPDGTGNLLLSKTFQSLIMGPGAGGQNSFDIWQLCKFPFPGMARSVVITATANQCAFDDLTFGEASKGSGKGIKSTGGDNSSKFMSILTTPKAPTEKGKLFLMGASRFDFSFGSEKSKSNGSTVEGSETIYYNLDFLPKAGYYFINNLVGGIFMDLELYNNKPNTETGYGYEKGTTFIAGPFARYYVPVTDKVLPFAEVQFGFGLDHSSSKSSASADWSTTKESVFTYRLGAGATYFINEVVGVDGFIGYLHDSYKYIDLQDGSRSSDSKTIYNEFTMQLGIVIVLDVCKK